MDLVIEDDGPYGEKAAVGKGDNVEKLRRRDLKRLLPTYLRRQIAYEYEERRLVVSIPRSEFCISCRLPHKPRAPLGNLHPDYVRVGHFVLRLLRRHRAYIPGSILCQEVGQLLLLSRTDDERRFGKLERRHFFRSICLRLSDII